MRKFLLLSGVILIHSIAVAQFAENFSDGDFTANPSWTGDTTSYKINTAFQLQLNATGEGVAALAAANGLMPDMEWDFWIKLSFSPSDNNLARVYLSADQPDLKGTLNGYYLKFGETGSNDAIELVRQSGNSHSVICRGTNGLLSASFAIRIKVIRAAGGIWSVFADPKGGINYQPEASGTDNTFTTGSFIGIFSKFTSSNSTKFYYDDFYAGPIIIDNTPPEIRSVLPQSANMLSVLFSEAVTTGSAGNVNNYRVSPGTLVPVEASKDEADPAIVHLVFPQNFTPDESYSLSVSNVTDLAGNTMADAQRPFVVHQPKTFDVLINEIMADPSPPVNLPDAEYVELYNRSAFPVDLKDWVLIVGNSVKPLPAFTLAAQGYVILCDDGAESLFEPFGAVVGFSSFAVTNAGGTITIVDPNGYVIHSVSYTDDWYQSSYKNDGGWSLELIDALNPCGGSANWIACSDDAGGTPGKVNAVNAPNPDLVPPGITRVGVDDATHITVWFSESCDSTAISKTDNFTIDNGIGNPIIVIAQSPAYLTASLTLESPLQAGVLYTLTATGNIADCAGNLILTGSSASFAIPSVAGAGDIVLNELLFDPAAGCADFAEVYNRSTKVIDLRDLILANYDTIAQVATSYNEISKFPYLMLPDTYFVLTTDTAAVTKFYKTTNHRAFINMGSFPSMNNEDGVVALASKGGKVIDVVAYSVAMQYPLLINVDGVSLERISPERQSEDVTNWHSASGAVGYGTPGYKNSQFGITLSDENEVTLSPDIFSPDNDGYNDNLTIAYTFGEPGNNATITIYDVMGRLVRNLVSHQLCGTTGAFAWDGITNDRLKAPTGRYIVFVEIFDLKGNVRHLKKTTVLGTKL